MTGSSRVLRCVDVVYRMSILADFTDPISIHSLANRLEATGTARRTSSAKAMSGSSHRSKLQVYEDEEEPVSHLV